MANLFYWQIEFWAHRMHFSNTHSKISWPLFALTILLLPDILWIVRSSDPLDALQHGLLFSLCVLVGGVAWSGRRFRLLLWLGLPFALLVPFESYYVWHYTFPSSAHVLAIVGETNIREIVGYFGYSLIFFLILAVFFIGFVYAIAIVRAPTTSVFPESRIWRWVGGAMLFPLFGLVLGEMALIAQSQSDELVQASDQQSVATHALLKDVRFGMDAVITTSFPFGVPFRISTYLAEQRRLDEARIQSRKNKVQASTLTDSPAELMVLVIGESARPDHWHINGYPRETTPEIESIPEAVSLSNVLSPWPATRNAVPSLLTGLLDDRGLPPVAVPSVIDVFRAAGWDTYWLSNQSPLGMHDSTIVLHAERAQYRRFLNGGDYTQASDLDGVLIPALENVLKDGVGRRQLVILHLLGSHLEYEDRYPRSFARFEKIPSAYEKIGGFRAVHDRYDNSLLYTDYVLGQFIRLIRSSERSAAMIYVSDHGQNLPDLECQKIGHGHPAEDSLRSAALVWISPQLELKRPGVSNLLRMRASAPLHLNDVFPTFIDLAAINYAHMDQLRSWVSEQWKPAPRLLGGGVNFDEVDLEGACRVLKRRLPKQASR